MAPTGLDMIEDGLRLDKLHDRMKTRHPGQAAKVKRLADRKINSGIKRLSSRPRRRGVGRSMPTP